MTVMMTVPRKVTRTIAIMMMQVVRSDGGDGEGEGCHFRWRRYSSEGVGASREEGAATAAKQRWMLAAAPPDTSHHAR